MPQSRRKKRESEEKCIERMKAKEKGKAKSKAKRFLFEFVTEARQPSTTTMARARDFSTEALSVSAVNIFTVYTRKRGVRWQNKDRGEKLKFAV